MERLHDHVLLIFRQLVWQQLIFVVFNAILSYLFGRILLGSVVGSFLILLALVHSLDVMEAPQLGSEGFVALATPEALELAGLFAVFIIVNAVFHNRKMVLGDRDAMA